MQIEKRAATVLAVDAAAKQVREDIVDQLMLKEHAKGTKTPSSPGEPPAMITGRLKASVRATPATPIGLTRAEAKVGPTAPYSRIHELGGTAGHGAHLPARPYVAPGLAKARPKLRAIFRAMWSATGIGR
jgi:phage gpG-like protein